VRDEDLFRYADVCDISDACDLTAAGLCGGRAAIVNGAVRHAGRRARCGLLPPQKVDEAVAASRDVAQRERELPARVRVAGGRAEAPGVPGRPWTGPDRSVLRM
jgi:hypothetical protein